MLELAELRNLSMCPLVTAHVACVAQVPRVGNHWHQGARLPHFVSIGVVL